MTLKRLLGWCAFYVCGFLFKWPLSLCVIGLAVMVATSCATGSQKCTYFPDGTLETYKLRSTVVGTGETEIVTTDCAALGYSTKDTGLSDNGKAALGTIAEGAAKGLSPVP
jgi:hypothetical protein